MRQIYKQYITPSSRTIHVRHGDPLQNGSVRGISPQRRNQLMKMFQGNPKLKSIIQKALVDKKFKATTLKAKNHFFTFMNLVTSIKNKKMSNQQMEKAQRLYRERNTIMLNNPFSQLYTEPFEITKKLHNVDVLADKYQKYAFLNNERSMNATLKEYKLLLNTVNILNRQRTVQELRALQVGVKRELLEELQKIRKNMFDHLTKQDFEKAQNLQRKYERIYELRKGINNKYNTVTPQDTQAMINDYARNPTLKSKNKLDPQEAIALGRKISPKKKINVNFSTKYYNARNRFNNNQMYNARNRFNNNQMYNERNRTTQHNTKPKKKSRKPWLTVPRAMKTFIGATGALFTPLKTNLGKYNQQPYAGQLALPPGPTRLALTRKREPNYFVDPQYLYRNLKPKGTKTF